LSSWRGGDESPSPSPEAPVRDRAELVSVPPSTADGLAASLRGFGPLGLLAMLLILLTGNVAIAPMLYVPVGAILTLVWARASRTPWRAIGYVRPRSWARTVALGVALGVAFKLAMKSIVMPLLGAEPVNHAYHFLVGNRALLPVAIYAMLNAGFAEETVFRGYAFERLGKLLGDGAWSRLVMVLVTAAFFGVAHLADQGRSGAEQAAIVGLVLGTMYAATRQLPLLMVTHAAFDLTALAIIHLDLESRVAHWVFR
jgi:membrane protease YdiL (CAAX protease family)